MIKNLDQLAGMLKVETSELENMIKSEEEIEVVIPQGEFINDEQLEGLKKEVSETAYIKGKDVGREVTIKEIKKRKGLDFEGKTVDTLIKYYDGKVLNDASIEPDKKIKELESSLDNLRNQYESDIKTKDNEILSYKSEVKKSKIDNKLMSIIPSNLQGIKQKQAAILFKTDNSIDLNENGDLVVMNNGEVLKDKMEKPIPINDVLNEYIIKNNWINSDGRSGGNSTSNYSSGFKTLNDVMKHMEKNNIDPMSNEGQSLMNKFKDSQG